MFSIADVAIGPTILFGGLAVGVALFIPVVLLEALIMWRQKWGTFKESLIDSGIANLVSTLVGLGLFWFFVNQLFTCEVLESADKTQVSRDCGFEISPLLWLVITGLLSIVIEALVLQLRKGYPARITWDAAIATNVVSYVLLAALGVAWIMLS